MRTNRFQFRITCQLEREQEVKLLASQCLWSDEVSLLGMRGRAMNDRWAELVVEVAAEHLADSWIEGFIRRVATEPGVLDIGMRFVFRAARAASHVQAG